MATAATINTLLLAVTALRTPAAGASCTMLTNRSASFALVKLSKTCAASLYIPTLPIHQGHRKEEDCLFPHVSAVLSMTCGAQ